MNAVRECIFNVILFCWYRIAGFFFRLFPIENDKIVFESFFGKGYGDNPKYIAENLLKNTTMPLKIVWLIKGEPCDDFPKMVQTVKRGSFKELYHLSTAKVWVDNSRKHFGVRKRKNQYYMQTWHGSVYFKQIESDAKLSIWYRTSAKRDSKMADVLLSSSRWQTEQYRRCFWYTGTILEIGMPRNDFLAGRMKEGVAVKKKVYDYFQIDCDKKIVLYAPTFRGDGNLDAYDIDYQKLMAALQKYWNGKWIVLVRLHPNIAGESSLVEYGEGVFNASLYSDMNELLLASELLITDYSSCLFDAVYIEKASIIYASDIEEYNNKRGFTLPLSAAPVLIARNNMELEDRIKRFVMSTYIKKCQKFSDEYGIIHRSDASKRAADWIMSIVSKNS